MKAVNKKDLYFPIPEDSLIKRLKPVFSKVEKGYSTAYLGLNGSGRTTHIRCVLSSKSLLEKLLSQKKKNKLNIIFISYESLPDKSVTTFAKAILCEIKNNLVGNKESKKQIDSILLTNDVYLILDQIKQTLSTLIKKDSSFRLIIIIDQLEKLTDFDPMIGMVIKSIWQIERRQPIEKISFLFLGSPGAFYQENNSLSKTIRFIVGQNILYSPLLSDREITYSLKRHSRLQEFRLKNDQFSFLHHFLGAIGSLLRYGIQIAKETKNIEELRVELMNSSLIRSLTLEIWQGLTDKEKFEMQNCLRTKKAPVKKSSLIKLGIYQNNKLSAEILKVITPWSTKENSESKSLLDIPEEMSPQEENFLRFLIKHTNKVVSKDEVAEALWGKDYLEKYSDWAMAQIVARLRKKIAAYHKPITILTLRGRGYKLVS